MALWAPDDTASCEANTLTEWQSFESKLGRCDFKVRQDPMPQFFLRGIDKTTGEIVGHETGALVPFPIHWLMRLNCVAPKQSPGFLTRIHEGYHRDKAR